MKNIKLVITTAVSVVCLMLAIILTFVLTSNHYKKKQPEVEYREKVIETEKIVKEDIVISGKTMEAGINNIGLLATAEYYFTHVENYKSSKEIEVSWLEKTFEIPGTTSGFIYSYDGVVMAGIDFTKVKVEKTEDTKKIVVTLPQAAIMSSSIDPDSFKLYDEKNNIFNPIEVRDVTDSLNDLLKTEEEKALSTGLIDKANDNATNLVTNFLKSTYHAEEYEISVEFEASMK